nr:PREDICTED: chondroitin sulfate synthase 2 [Bemisia tabaci]
MSVVSQCRQHIYFSLGFILGLILSLIFVVRVEDGCSLFSLEIISLDSDIISNVFKDEFEPKINSAGKPLKAQKTPQTLVRPRYFSTELGIKEKLFVGVLTTYESISSHGIAFNKTVGHLVDKLLFFINAPGSQKLNVSLLKLPGIVRFTNTRSLLQPFHAIKYISDNFIDEFDFFFLIKSDAYVKASSLNKIIESISVSEHVHVGVKADPKSSFCSLDSGLLLSNSVLQKLQSDLDWCVKNILSHSDDENVGHCILHSTNLPCQQKVESCELGSIKLNKNFDLETLLANSSMREKLEKVITIHPLEKPSQFYQLHAYFSKSELDHTKQEILNLRRSLLNVSVNAPSGPQSLTWPLGNQPENKPLSRFDVLRWDYFNETHIYFDSDFSNLRPHTTPEKLDVQNVIKACVSRVAEKYEGQFEYQKLLNGYKKFDPSRGMDYLLDLIFRVNTDGKYIHKRFAVCKPLGKVEFLPVPYVTENTKINILLPVKPADKAHALKFLQQYRQMCMMKRDKTFLMMVLLYDSTVPGKGTKSDVFKSLKDTAVNYSKQFSKDGSKIVWVSIKIPNKDPSYLPHHEALLDFAIADLALKKFRSDSLILLAHLNLEIKPDFLNRVRMNTIQNWQVFSPVPFREYHPAIVYEGEPPAEVELNKQSGHYDSTNTQHISFYASDYLSARQSIAKTIPLVRSDKNILDLYQTSNQEYNKKMESLIADTIYSMFVSASNLHVLRAVEPGLRIRYEPIDCPSSDVTHDSNLKSLIKKCNHSRSFSFGMRSQLSKLILSFKNKT